MATILATMARTPRGVVAGHVTYGSGQPERGSPGEANGRPVGQSLPGRKNNNGEHWAAAGQPGRAAGGPTKCKF